MSLCIATSVPDAIVFSSDTLQTMSGMSSRQIIQQCSGCQNQNNLTLNIPVPFGNFPTASKHHHIKVPLSEDNRIWDMVILNAGDLNIGNERVSKIIREFESTIKENEKIDDIANNLKAFFETKILSNLNLNNISEYNKNINLILGGYDINDNDLQKKFLLKINKTPTLDNHSNYGSAWIGKVEIPSLLNNNSILSQMGLNAINLLFNSMNIQDAIDYNRFLIKTVSEFQRFAPMIPDVGGEVQISILFKNKPHKWVHKMELK